jgi:threonine/homoserine/homoserine lactone efflux protein
MNLWGFAVAMAIFAASPGLGIMAVVGRSLGMGFIGALPLVMGIVVGDVIFLLLAVFGLAAIATHIGPFFIVIKYLGAAYLVYVGIKLWMAADDTQKIVSNKAQNHLISFVGGIMIPFGNPKAILFYMAFLPAFVDVTEIDAIEILQLGVVVFVVLAAVLLAYALAAAKVRSLFTSRENIRHLNKGSGAIMMGAGVGVAAL